MRQKANSIWAAVPEHPITKTLSTCVSPKRSPATRKGHIVSEKLCDDILQRLSPYLLRNAPVDILDLWPGPGVLSSKINDFLKPRRHVLIEPNLPGFRPVLEPLAKSRSCYKLVSGDLSSIRDWQSLLNEHFPGQGPSNSDTSGALPRNDTLLVLANPPPSTSDKDHFSGSRFLSHFIAACIRQYGLHAYGSVRLLASLSLSERTSVFSRTVSTRGRPSLLLESIPLHAFEVAAPEDETKGHWGALRLWDTIVASDKRVAERTAENNVVVPIGRAQPPLQLAPEAPEPDRMNTPYTPRIKTPQNDKYVKIYENFDKSTPESPKYDELKKKRERAVIQLNQENRQTHYRYSIAGKMLEIDELNKTISRLAADEKTERKDITRVLRQIASKRKDLEKETNNTHFDTTRAVPQIVDDSYATASLGNFDNSVLLWDRRPFDPLFIHEGELFPHKCPRAFIYFEADPNARVMRRLQELTPRQQINAVRLFDAFTLTLTTNNTIPIEQFLETIFPNRTINECVRAIPSLARHATKRLATHFRTTPKTLHYNPIDLPTPDSKPDPINSYQANLRYELKGVNMRTFPADTLWAIAVEYARSGREHSLIQLTRMLGGTLTTAIQRDFMDEPVKIKR
ncbi:hypothetical protein BJY04DRAFT_193233 [Aspergillus karnatakaensis]|uniref:uncharacterized protein n=1 Tax=Aspergillus karnatakaensis TaxID=1810916 RepID=UPI003CCCB912